MKNAIRAAVAMATTATAGIAQAAAEAPPPDTTIGGPMTWTLLVLGGIGVAVYFFKKVT